MNLGCTGTRYCCCDFCVPPGSVKIKELNSNSYCVECHKKEITGLKKDLLLKDAEMKAERYRSHGEELTRLITLYNAIIQNLQEEIAALKK